MTTPASPDLDSAGPPEGADNSGGGNRRLVVELYPQVYGVLTKRTEIEHLNKTTVTNRAIQLYGMITDVLESGGKVYIQEPGDDHLQGLRIL